MHLWDDIVDRPPAERSLKHSQKPYAKPLNIKDVLAETSKFKKSLTMPASPVTPGTPTTPSPTALRKDNVWRSVFHPGSNLATRSIGADYFDRPQPNSPTVYDWLYSGETRSKHI